MDSVGVYEAKTYLSRLLERVSKGECITITRHGLPVAVLKPYDLTQNADVKTAIHELREFRKKTDSPGARSGRQRPFYKV